MGLLPVACDHGSLPMLELVLSVERIDRYQWNSCAIDGMLKAAMQRQDRERVLSLLLDHCSDIEPLQARIRALRDSKHEMTLFESCCLSLYILVATATIWGLWTSGSSR